MKDEPRDVATQEALFRELAGAKLDSATLLDFSLRVAADDDPERLEILKACAIPRRFDEEIIGVLRDDPDSERNRELLALVEGQHFVVRRQDGDLVYHDTVRDTLVAGWRRDDRERFDTYSQRLATHHRAKHDEYAGMRRDFNLVAGLIHSSNERRYELITTELERRLLAPLFEALYHEAERSAELAFEFFQAQYHHYEDAGRFSICQALLDAARDSLTRVPEGGGRRLAWLEQYQGRLERAEGMLEAAEARLKPLLDRVENDDHLRIWVLSELAAIYRDQFRTRDAREVMERELALSLETGADPWNLPTSYARLGGLEWTLSRLRVAEELYRSGLAAASEVGNRLQQVASRLCLSAVLFEQGRVEEGVEVALAALDFTWVEAPHDLSVHLELATQLTSQMRYALPELVDAFFHEALELNRLLGNTQQEPVLRADAVPALADSGLLNRAQEVLDDLHASPGLDTDATRQRLLAESLLRIEQGRVAEAVDAAEELIHLVGEDPAGAWLKGASQTNRGRQLTRMGRWEEAEAELRAGLAFWQRGECEPLCGVAKTHLADLYRLRASSVVLEGAPPEGAPAGWDAWAEAERSYRSGDLAGAADRFQRIGRDSSGPQGPGNGWSAHLSAARCLGELGRWAEAAEASRQAVAELQAGEGSIRPSWSLYRVKLDLSQSAELLDQADRELPEEVARFVTARMKSRAELLLFDGRVEEAEALLIRAAEADARIQRTSAAAATTLTLATARAERGDRPGAVEALESAAEGWARLASRVESRGDSAPELANARGVAQVVASDGQTGEIARGLDRIRNAAADRPGLLFDLNLGFARAALLDWSGAAEALTSAMERRPEAARSAALAARRGGFRLEEAERLLGLKDGAAQARGQLLGLAEGALSGGDVGPAERRARNLARLGDGLVRAGEWQMARQVYLKGGEAPAGDSKISMEVSRTRMRRAFLEMTRGRREEGVQLLGSALADVEDAERPATWLREWTEFLASKSDYHRVAEALRQAERGSRSEEEVLRIRELRRELARRLGDVLERSVDRGEGVTRPEHLTQYNVVTLVALEIHPSLVPEGDWEAHHPFLTRYLPEMRARIEQGMGVRVPGVRVRSNESLAEGQYVQVFRNVPVAVGSCRLGAYFVPHGEGGPEGEAAYNPLSGLEDGYWVEGLSPEQTDGFDVWEYMVRHLELSLRRSLDRMLSATGLRSLVDEWVSQDPSDEPRRRALLTDAVPNEEAWWSLLRVARRLLVEWVPIRDLETILEAFAARGRLDEIGVGEAIRRQLRAELPGNDPGRVRLEVGAELLERLRAAVQTEPQRVFAAEPSDAQAIHGALLAALDGLEGRAGVVVVPGELRPFLRRFVEAEDPSLLVLAAEEIVEERPSDGVMEVVDS